MRETWTDERLDHLKGRVGEMSRRMDGSFSRLDSKSEALDARVDLEVDALRAEMTAGFRSLNNLIVGFGGTLLVAVAIDAILGRL